MNSTVRLTAREYEVAEKLALGASKKEIPDLLTVKPGHHPISIQTVEVITKNIYSKLGIQKVSELCIWFLSTRYHIEVDLSPIKRKAVSALLLTIVVFTELTTSHDFIRPMNGRAMRSVVRTGRSGRKDGETLELLSL